MSEKLRDKFSDSRRLSIIEHSKKNFDAADKIMLDASRTLKETLSKEVKAGEGNSHRIYLPTMNNYFFSANKENNEVHEDYFCKLPGFLALHKICSEDAIDMRIDRVTSEPSRGSLHYENSCYIRIKFDEPYSSSHYKPHQSQTTSSPRIPPLSADGL